MEDILKKIPFLRILISFVLGIALADQIVNLQGHFIVLTLFIITLLFYALNSKHNYLAQQVYGFVLSIFIFSCGYTYTQVFNDTKDDCLNGEYYQAMFLEKPVKKSKSYKSEIKLLKVVSFGKGTKTKEHLIAYFQPGNGIDTFKAGDQILFKTHPEFIKNAGNPHEFNYKKYLARKRIYRQVYLYQGKWKPFTGLSANTIQTFAEKIRESLLSIYRDNNLSEEKFTILSALTLGYKEVLGPEVKAVFASAGAMHILAVSGLHVGIIYLIFNFLFGFLKTQKNGRLFFTITSILVLWCYAIITGLSPSVLRAATMFSFLIIGNNLNRPVNVYNSLAASAFLLLMFNPNLLFEVGFQLSYTAVVGIVFFQPKFYKLLIFRNWLGDKLWALFTVSLSAQLSTLPFSLYYFNQFPVYAWLSNFVVIPAAFIFIFMGMSILIFSPIDTISGFLGKLTSILVDLLYSFLSSFRHLPYYLIQGIYISQTQMILLLITLLLIMLFITNKKTIHLKLTLVAICLVFAVSISQKYTCLKQKEIIIYSNGKKKLIHFIDGTKNYLVFEKPINTNSKYILKNVLVKKNLDTPIWLDINKFYEDSCLLITQNLISFHGKNILFANGTMLAPGFQADICICNNTRSLNSLHSFPVITYNPHLKTTSTDKNIHCINTDGAYVYRF